MEADQPFVRALLITASEVGAKRGGAACGLPASRTADGCRAAATTCAAEPRHRAEQVGDCVVDEDEDEATQPRGARARGWPAEA